MTNLFALLHKQSHLQKNREPTSKECNLGLAMRMQPLSTEDYYDFPSPQSSKINSVWKLEKKETWRYFKALGIVWKAESQ